MSINEMRSIALFVKAAELGSLRKAAASQGVTPQGASKVLAQLEEHLGVRLFHRTTRSLALTDEGRQFLALARPALTDLTQALEITRRAKYDIAGPLRIVGPRSIFAPVLWPLLDEFTRLWPQVQLDVKLDDRIGNWVEDRVDVGFRIGFSAAEGVIARKLFGLQLIVCASPEYLRQYGVPASIDALTSHRCSVYRSAATDKLIAWRLRNGRESIELRVTPTLSVNDEGLETRAILAGRAVGQLTGVSAAAHIRSGRLVPLLVQHVDESASVFLYYGSRTTQPARVRAFIDLAVEHLTGGEEFVLGAKELAAAERLGRAQAQANSTKPSAKARSAEP